MRAHTVAPALDAWQHRAGERGWHVHVRQKQLHEPAGAHRCDERAKKRLQRAHAQAAERQKGERVGRRKQHAGGERQAEEHPQRKGGANDFRNVTRHNRSLRQRPKRVPRAPRVLFPAAQRHAQW
jgi:hypothetical protein